MKSLDLVNSVFLLDDYGMQGEANRLLDKALKSDPKILSEDAVGVLRKVLESNSKTPATKRGTKKGYKFQRRQCQICGKEIAGNWWMRHMATCTG